MKKNTSSPAEELCEQYCTAYSTRDLPRVVNLFTEQSQLWGTAADEFRQGLHAIEEQHQRDWQQSEHSSIRVIKYHNALSNGNWVVADFAVDLQINGQHHHFEDLRGTIITVQTEKGWKIAHMHASFPDYRNPNENSFPVAV